MELTKYVLLKESLKTAKEKYLDTNKLTKGVFDILAENDFTKTKKYLEWLCKVYVTDTRTFDEDGIDRLIELLHKFDKVVKTKYKLPSKDINYYKTIDELYTALNDFDTYSNNRRTAKKHKGAEKIFENDKCILYYIKTKEACLLYGAHTKWCITEKNITDVDYWFDYNFENFFVFLLDKINPTTKYAFALNLKKYIDSDKVDFQLFNTTDNEIELEIISDVLEEYDLDLYMFSNIIKQNISKEELKDNGINKMVENGYWKKNSDGTYDILKTSTIDNMTYITEAMLNETKTSLAIKFNKCNTGLGCTYMNTLINLKGLPKIIKGDLVLSHLGTLKDLKGCPKIVEGNFIIKYCEKLQTLKDCPKEIRGELYISGIDLKSLKGTPKQLFSFRFYAYNSKITTLEDGPETVLETYALKNCNYLTSLKGIKKAPILYILDCFNLQNLREELDRIEGLKKIYISDGGWGRYNYVSEEDQEYLEQKYQIMETYQ